MRRRVRFRQTLLLERSVCCAGKCPTAGVRFVRMRNSGLWLCGLLLAPECLASDCADHSLKALYQSEQLFELREAANNGGAPIFCQGIVACAFNEIQQCEKKLKSVIKAAPRSTDARQARTTLAAV
jgi:hypothetical protein